MTSRAAEVSTVSEWLNVLSTPDGWERLGFARHYGAKSPLWEERASRIRGALLVYRERFGDLPVHVVRSPGRINLRGMHVDTHGGYLNLMTHQREVVLVVGKGAPGRCEVANTNEDFAPLSLAWPDLPQRSNDESWGAFLERPDVQQHVADHAGCWRNYITGSWLRASMALGVPSALGLHIVVDSNLPRGAALSSSAALCLALLEGWCAWHETVLSDDEKILAAQDAEWFTGSRCGTCDQAAIVLGSPGHISHGALFPKVFRSAEMTPVAFPDALRVLVINSYTRRSISGAEKVAYTRNRFAYSMAIAIVQQTLAQMGYKESEIRYCDRLSHITGEHLGGDGQVLRVLKEIPVSLDLATLRERYTLPEFDAEYTRYFADVAEAERPKEIMLRGPLLFGIAESARARHFARALHTGAYELAGEMMSCGHDGDRRIDSTGVPFVLHPDDKYLAHHIEEATPLHALPGAYGASSPALDVLVDCARAHGALGASLTGAGIAGTVLALCHGQKAPSIAEGVRAYMAGTEYQRVAGLSKPLTEDELADAVVVNRAVAGAGKLTLAG